MKTRQVLLLIIVLLVTACYTGRRQQVLSLLDRADSLNRAYAQLPPDSLLAEAARFLDRHGTPDEQLRAYYLLGCAYRDQGRAPEALQAWHYAIDRADTIHGDKQRLMAVYGQMAELFDNQNLPEDELAAANVYGKLALLIGDLSAAIQ